LVTGALFFIIAALALRAGGSESLDRMGGIAFRAPVLAGLFLIVALATLAMPGSANFVGELLILFGTFEDKLVYGIVASLGVALAAVYTIRLFQRSMHFRVGPGVESRDLGRPELLAIVPIVLVILALGVYPQFVLERTEAATTAKVTEAEEVADRGAGETAPEEVPVAPGPVPVGPDGVPVGPDGVPVGPDGVPVGPDGVPVGPDGVPVGPDGAPLPPDAVPVP